MLSRSSYPDEHIQRTRQHLENRMAAWDQLRKKAPEELADELDSFESAFFNDLIFVLDAHFVHRGRGIEGKDGNPLNEVRLLCNSIVENDSVLARDAQIKLKPETSVLGLDFGNPIAIRREEFATLADAFLDEIQAKFPEG